MLISLLLTTPYLSFVQKSSMIGGVLIMPNWSLLYAYLNESLGLSPSNRLKVELIKVYSLVPLLKVVLSCFL